MKKALAVFCLIVAFGAPALANKDEKNPVVPAVTPPAVTTVPLQGVGAALDNLQADPAWSALTVDWTGLRTRYNNGGGALWVTPPGLSPLGALLNDQLRAAAHAGMPLAPVLTDLVADGTQPGNQAEAAEIEAKLSAALTATAIDAQGLLATDGSRGAAILDAIASAKQPDRALQSQLPGYRPFWRLHSVLQQFAGYYQEGGWDKVPGKEKMEPGDRGTRVAAVKERLMATGELASKGTDFELYDDALKQAVLSFQRSHGLNDDGVIGVRTIEEMNVSAEDRLRSILLNLKRMRDEGPSLEPRHMVVNIPGTELRIVEDGKTIYFTKAIVGRVERKTPLLSSVINLVKFNPDWSVPARIAAIDMLRHELEEPGYFAERNVRVYDSSGAEIDPNSVDWQEIKNSGHFPYRLRQDPGPENALGPMKLDFKNDHAVFIHGTSAPALFAKQDRFFSSGCVRVQDPLDLAAFLLKDDATWDRARIDAVVKKGDTEFVTLPRPIAVHFVYRTAWVDEDGTVQFRRDVYKYDKRPAIPVALASSGLLASTGGTGKSTGNNK